MNDMTNKRNTNIPLKTDRANEEEQKIYHFAVVNMKWWGLKPGFIRAQYSPLVTLYWFCYIQ